MAEATKFQGYATAIVFLSSLFLLTECKESELPSFDSSFIVGKWEVVSITYPTGATITPLTTYIMTFRATKKLEIKLDVNGCGGEFNVIDSRNINVSLSCTKVGGESEFTREFFNYFANSKYYSLNGDILTLEGLVIIVFKKVP